MRSVCKNVYLGSGWHTFFFFEFAFEGFLFATTTAAVGFFWHRDTVHASILKIAVYFWLILLTLYDRKFLNNKTNNWLSQNCINSSDRWTFPFAIKSSEFDFERSHFFGFDIILFLLWFRCRFWLLTGIGTCKDKYKKTVIWLQKVICKPQNARCRKNTEYYLSTDYSKTDSFLTLAVKKESEAVLNHKPQK